MIKVLVFFLIIFCFAGCGKLSSNSDHRFVYPQFTTSEAAFDEKLTMADSAKVEMYYQLKTSLFSKSKANVLVVVVYLNATQKTSFNDKYEEVKNLVQKEIVNYKDFDRLEVKFIYGEKELKNITEEIKASISK